MNKRKQVMRAGLLMVVLVCMLVPLSAMLELGKQKNQTAEEVYEPILHIHNQIIAEKAQQHVPVGGLIELEDAWAIEDMREESVEPLVTSMLNGRDVMGFDYADNTFYCTLGMETGEDWPDVQLRARNAPDGLEIRLVDDYTYDWCSDAIREGYRYELMAYTDTQYSYFGVVFTGLPIVSVSVDNPDELGDEYVPARAAVSSAGYEAVDHTAMVHLRGGGAKKPIDKKPYRIEFHEINNRGKDKKKKIGLLGMEADTDWLLISNASDDTCVRNQLSWDLWNKWNPDGDAIGLLESRLVEVFVNDEYMGIYQLMQRYDVKKEIERIGGNLQTDFAFRVIRGFNAEPDRPAEDYEACSGMFVELRYKPEHISDEQAFGVLDDYIKMNYSAKMAVADEEFIRLVQEYVDMDILMSYYLFHQAADLDGDNIFNNLYIWLMRNEQDGYTLRLSPWDMDYGLSNSSWDESVEDQVCLAMPMPRRILDMNLEDSRDIIWSLWKEKRSGILSDDAIYQWIMDMEEYVNRSGAALRNSLKWYGYQEPLDLSRMTANEIRHMTTIEDYFQWVWTVDEKDMQQ